MVTGDVAIFVKLENDSTGYSTYSLDCPFDLTV